MASEFDFIIVGGGTAGLVLAARLSEKPNVQVLVVEAGEDLTADPRVNVPAMWPQLQGSDADWQLKTVPQVRPRLFSSASSSFVLFVSISPNY
jgi:choline dehydrogenase-like flavoprotein